MEESESQSQSTRGQSANQETDREPSFVEEMMYFTSSCACRGHTYSGQRPVPRCAWHAPPCLVSHTLLGLCLFLPVQSLPQRSVWNRPEALRLPGKAAEMNARQVWPSPCSFPVISNWVNYNGIKCYNRK